MSNGSRTLRHVFGDLDVDPRAIGNSGRVAELRSNPSLGLAQAGWERAVEEVRSHAAALLDVDLGDLMRRAWKSASAAAETLRRSREKPAEPLTVNLIRHRISSKHHPKLELLVGEQVVGAISCEVEVALDLDGAALVVKNGEIIELRPGSCRATGTFKIEDVLIKKIESAPIELPGAWRFGDPAPR